MRDRSVEHTQIRLDREKANKIRRVQAAPTKDQGIDGDFVYDGTYVYIKVVGVWVRFDNVTEV